MRFKTLLCLALVVCLLPLHALMQGGSLTAYDHYIGRQHYLLFGQYPGRADGGETPILWRVLKKDKQQVVLLSEYVLDVIPGHVGEGYNGYAASTLKAWLENEFKNAAFHEEQQALLLSAKGQPPLRLPDAKLLDEKNLGMAEDAMRAAVPTAYALSKGVLNEDNLSAAYWMREQSVKDKGLQRVILPGGVSDFIKPAEGNIGVRPVLTLDARKLGPVTGYGSLNDPYVITGIPQLLPEKAPLAENTPQPAVEDEGGSMNVEGFPPLTGQGFLPAGEEEFVFIDETAGLWRFANADLRIEIMRHTHQTERLRWLTAEIFVRPGASTFFMAPYDKENMLRDLDKYLNKQDAIARQHNLVFTMGGDYFIYRLGAAKRDKVIRAVGVEIRDHRILVDKPAIKDRTFLPPLDHLAIFPDGDMKVYAAGEITGQELVDLGARDVLSFGPWLIRDGVINESYSTYGTTLQPRSMIGMVEKGHYWAVVVEGRIGPSNGLTLPESTQLMKELGCTLAYNLDGGWTSAMIFMGKQLNQLDKNGVRNNARTQNEVLGIGYTDAYLEGRYPLK